MKSGLDGASFALAVVANFLLGARQRSYAPGAAIGLSLGGVPAVLVAALVAVVAVYTAVMLLRAARRQTA